MKLTIPQPFLADLLNKGGAVAAKGGSTIMTHVRLVTRNDSLFVASTDGKRFAESSATADVAVQGSTTVNATALNALISRYPAEGIVSLEIESPILLRVKCGRSRVGFGIMPASSFPDWGAIDAVASYAVPGPALSAALTRLRPLYGPVGYPNEGVMFEASEGVLNLGTFNGNAVGWAKIAAPAGGPPMGVPAEVADAFTRMFKAEPTVTLHVGEKRIGFEAGGMRLESQLIHAPANPYRKVMDVRDPDKLMSFDRVEFLQAADRAMLATEEGQFSALAVIPREDGLELRTRNSKGGDVREGVDAEVSPDVTPFAVNPLFIRSILGSIDSERATIEQTDGGNRYLVYSNDDDSYIGCFAPVRFDQSMAA